jgi:hypothetical protein
MDKFMPDEKPTSDQTMQFKRAEDFVSAYANNVFFETSVFDIKLTFGELCQPYKEQPYIEQHTSISLPWLQAKIACLLWAINIAAHEKKYGIITIPEGVLPLSLLKGDEVNLPLTRLNELIEQRPPLKPEVPAADKLQ